LSALRLWLVAARPRTLPAAVAPVLVGTALAIEADRFDALAFVAALVLWRATAQAWVAAIAPEHLQLLSAEVLRILLAGAGLRAQRMRATGANPYELLPAVRGRQTACVTGFDRVGSGYGLLVEADGRPALGTAKAVVNGVLGAFGIGNSLPVWTVSP